MRWTGWPHLLATVVAVSVSVGCGGGSPAARTSPGSTDPDVALGASTVVTPGLRNTSTTTSAAPATTLVPPPTAALDDLAATTAITPLVGFSEVAMGPGLGPLDLADASGADSREREALTRFGFRDGTPGALPAAARRFW